MPGAPETSIQINSDFARSQALNHSPIHSTKHQLAHPTSRLLIQSKKESDPDGVALSVPSPDGILVLQTRQIWGIEYRQLVTFSTAQQDTNLTTDSTNHRPIECATVPGGGWGPDLSRAKFWRAVNALSLSRIADRRLASREYGPFTVTTTLSSSPSVNHRVDLADL
jgi:hypothetical protein